MNLKTVITGKAFALVRFGTGSAYMLKHLASRRSCWVNEEDAANFYRNLGTNLESSVDMLLSKIWADVRYSAGSWSDQVA